MIHINGADRFECEKNTQSVYYNESPNQQNDICSTLRNKIYHEFIYRYTKTSESVMKYSYGIIITQAEIKHFFIELKIKYMEKVFLQNCDN